MTDRDPLPQHEIIEQFREAMRSCGIELAAGVSIVPDAVMHRVDLAGARKGSKTGWYRLFTDGIPAGAFGDWRSGVNETWCAKKPREMSQAERDELRARMEQVRREREAEIEADHAKARDVAAKVYGAARNPDPDHPYLVRKGVVAGSALRQTADGKLVVPMYRADRVLAGVQTIDAEGVKRFTKGCEKKGSYCSIGRLTDTVVIVEGYATGASVHMATALCCVIAFDAGNLLPVARAIRAKYPDRRIIIAGDNDAWTLEPVANPGATRAREAAAEIDCDVVIPDFGPLGPDERPTDFNDLHARAGLEQVAAQIDAARHHKVVSIDAARQARGEPAAPPVAPSDPDVPIDAYQGGDGPVSTGWQPEPGIDPVPLGYDRGVYYYHSAAQRQIVGLPAGAHGKLGLMQLAPLAYWEDRFSNRKGADWDACADSMMRACEARGVFDPDRIIGRGVHIDAGRVVLHLGDKILVDGKLNGEAARPSMIVPGSENIYERLRRIRLHRAPALTDDEAAELIELLDLLPWTSADMAPLAAGWIVTAPICGALRWRPHIWVTGEGGSGKSWLIGNVVTPILGPMCVQYQGATTEAGIRFELGSDALPVVFDEAESQNEKAQERVQAILDLARQASSEYGAPIVKGGGNGKSVRYRIRSSFIFSSINLGMTQAADQSRTIVLSLASVPTDLDAEQKIERAEKFAYLEAQAARIVTPEFGSRLFARTLKMVETIRHNARVLAQAASELLGNRRTADTISTPLAGWWALQSREQLTIERAREVLARQTWIMGAAERNKTESDHDKAVRFLLERLVFLSPTKREAIADLLARAASPDEVRPDESGDAEAAKALLQIGIKVVPWRKGLPAENRPAMVYLARSHSQLEALFRGTPWSKSWASTLLQHPSAGRGSVVKFGRSSHRAIIFALGDLIALD
jgi:putative DNA primase/helicase